MLESSDAISKELNDNYEKALSALKRDNFDYAIELLSAIVAVKQDFARARHFLRISQRKKFQKSKQNLASKAFSSFFSLVYSIKALIFKLRNEPSLAIREYENIISLNPFNKNALLHLGKTFLVMGLDESAIYAFEETLECSPKNLFALKNLGKLYLEIGDYQKSRFYYKKILEIHPYDHDAEKGLRNLDALGTIKKGFSSQDQPDSFKVKI